MKIKNYHEGDEVFVNVVYDGYKIKWLQSHKKTKLNAEEVRRRDRRDRHGTIVGVTTMTVDQFTYNIAEVRLTHKNTTVLSPVFSLSPAEEGVDDVRSLIREMIFKVAEICAAEFHVPIENIWENNRSNDTHVLPRHCFIWAARKFMLNAPYRMLTSVTPLDHSSCVHAYQQWEERLDFNSTFPNQYKLEASISKRVAEKVLRMLNEGTIFVMPNDRQDIDSLIHNYDKLSASHIEACLKRDKESISDHEKLLLAHERRIEEIQSTQESLVSQTAA